MNAIDVTCERRADDGWTCSVTVSEAGREVTRHSVGVTDGDLDRLDPGAIDPADLVERSFAFLLERESPQSILRTFDLPVIGRYFPAYDADIRTRGRRP
jgi:hypothetical protein